LKRLGSKKLRGRKLEQQILEQKYHLAKIREEQYREAECDARKNLLFYDVIRSQRAIADSNYKRNIKLHLEIAIWRKASIAFLVIWVLSLIFCG